MGNYINYCCKLPNDPNYNNGTPEDKNEISNMKVKSSNKPKKGNFFPTPRSSRSPNGSTSIYSGSPRSQRSQMTNSQSKPLIFLSNDVSVAVNLLSGQTIYEKLLTGEILLKLISPMNDFYLSNIYEVIKSLYIITKKLIIKDEMRDLHDKYSEQIGMAIGYDNIDFNEMDDGETYNNLKNKLIDIVCDLVELYQFFKFTIAGGREPYSSFLWDNVGDIDEYLIELIMKAKKGIDYIKNSVLVKQMNNGSNVEINT